MSLNLGEEKTLENTGQVNFEIYRISRRWIRTHDPEATGLKEETGPKEEAGLNKAELYRGAFLGCFTWISFGIF